MRAILIVMLLAAIAVASPLLTEEFASSINAKQSLWTAGVNHKFANLSFQELQRFVAPKQNHMFLPKEVPKIRHENTDSDDPLPDNFDTRTKWPQCHRGIKDQQITCGAGWAIAVASALTERLCVKSSGKKIIDFSPQYMIDCDFDNFGCDGGRPETAWKYLEEWGTTTDACYPYNAYGSSCPSKCLDGKRPPNYKAENIREFYGDEEAKREIMKYGPISTQFDVYEDFFAYKTGIYAKTESARYCGVQGVEVLGWGVDNGVEYWIAANSWGTQWGDNGYFKIKVGECTFDAGINMVAGDPI